MKLPMHAAKGVLVVDGRCCFMSTSFSLLRGWIRFDSSQGNNMVRNAIGESFNPVSFAMQRKCFELTIHETLYRDLWIICFANIQISFRFRSDFRAITDVTATRPSRAPQNSSDPKPNRSKYERKKKQRTTVIRLQLPKLHI